MFHRTRRNCPACDREQTPFSFLVISRRKPSVAQKTQPFTPHGFRALLLSRSGLSFSTEPLADSSVWIFGWDISFPLWDTRPLISLGRLTGENIYGGVPWATFSEGVLPSPLAGVHSVQRASVRDVCLCPPMTDGDGPGAPDLDAACRTAGSFFHCCCWCWWWWWWKAGVTAFHTDRAPRAPIWCRPRGFSVGCATVSKHLSCLTFNVLVYRRVRSFLN